MLSSLPRKGCLSGSRPAINPGMTKPSGGLADRPFRRPDLSRRLNRARVLRSIRSHAPVSRPDLERLTGLAAGTVQTIVDELLAEGLLEAARAPAAGVTGRGRPRLLLQLNSRAALVAGVGLFLPDRIQFEIVDLSGSRVAVLERSDPLPREGPLLAKAIVQGLEALARSAGLQLTDLSGIGIGIPALVDSQAGAVHWPPGDIEDAYPLADVVERQLGVSVDLDNMGNMMARAEYWFAQSREDDFAVVLVGGGVGMGLYANGQLVTGVAGMAGELGHMKTGIDAPVRCACGAWDCLTAHVGLYRLARQALGRLGDDDAWPFDVRDAGDQVLALASEGDAHVTAVLDRAGALLGTAIANVANLVGPARIVVIFETGAFVEWIGPPLIRSFEAQTLPPVRARTSLIVRAGLNSLSQGAAAFALERIYAGPDVKLA